MKTRSKAVRHRVTELASKEKHRAHVFPLSRSPNQRLHSIDQKAYITEAYITTVLRRKQWAQVYQEVYPSTNKKDHIARR